MGSWCDQCTWNPPSCCTQWILYHIVPIAGLVTPDMYVHRICSSVKHFQAYKECNHCFFSSFSLLLLSRVLALSFSPVSFPSLVMIFELWVEGKKPAFWHGRRFNFFTQMAAKFVRVRIQKWGRICKTTIETLGYTVSVHGYGYISRTRSCKYGKTNPYPGETCRLSGRTVTPLSASGNNGCLL